MFLSLSRSEIELAESLLRSMLGTHPVHARWVPLEDTDAEPDDEADVIPQRRLYLDSRLASDAEEAAMACLLVDRLVAGESVDQYHFVRPTPLAEQLYGGPHTSSRR